MAIRASDRLTLQVVASVTYVRTFYLLQNSTLGTPSPPTTNPPAAPWTTVEPTYTAASTNSLYTVQLTVYGTAGFEYGPVQLSSSYEAAKAAFNRAESALTAANGKNKLYFQPTPPPGTSYVLGDTWFDTDDGNKIYSWVSPGTWAAAALGTNAIADSAIVNAKIANLDAGKINTGTLNANRIAANSILASKIVLGDPGNLILDPDFRDSASWNTSGTTRQILAKSAAEVPTGAPAATNVFRLASITGSNNDVSFNTGTPGNRIPVSPDDVYYVDYWIARSSDCNSNFRFYMTTTDAAAANPAWPSATGQTPANIPANTWVRVTSKIVVPAGKYLAAPQFGATNTGATAPLGAWYIANPMYRKAMQGELIVDGAITTRTLAAEAITAEKIKAGTITVNELAPSVGNDLVLTSNGTITTIVNAQSEQANQIANVRDTANSANSTAQDAATAAGNAQNQVSSLDTKVNAVDAEQKSTKNQVNNLQTWFRVDAAGAHVGQTGSIFQTHILPNQFNITENDVVTTYWESGRMVVPSLVADKMVLTNFTFEAYAGGMVVRLG